MTVPYLSVRVHSHTWRISAGTYVHCNLWRWQWWIWERFDRKISVYQKTETCLKLSRNGKNKVYLWVFLQPLFCLLWKVGTMDQVFNKESGNVTLNTKRSGSAHRILHILNSGRSIINQITQVCATFLWISSLYIDISDSFWFVNIATSFWYDCDFFNQPWCLWNQTLF